MEVDSPVVIPLIGDITTGQSGLASLFRFEQACRQHRNCTILVNTQRMKWLDANLCAIRGACFYRLHVENGLSFVLDRDQVAGRFSIFARNGFVSAEGISGRGAGNSAVELQTFGQDESDEFVHYIEHKLLGHHSLQLHPNLVSDFTNSFTEVFANVNLHANTTSPIFTCGQHFPQKGKLSFTLADLGDGYLLPIQRRFAAITTSAQAIQWALQPGHTSRPPEDGYFDIPGGYGLTNLHDYCKQAGGELQITTGNAFWSSTRPTICIPIEFFRGSIVTISLACPKN
jgi:hypothetical protein